MKNLLYPKKLRGSVVILVAVIMSTCLFAFVALAIDLSNLYSTTKQMQNAADAAALYGAANFTPPSSSGGPNFSQAQTKALSYIPNNKIDGVALSTGTVVTGYWDLTQAKPGVRTIVSPDVIGPNDAVAVQVTITKSAGVNGGPIKFYFAPIFGINTSNITVKAVAVSGSPASVPEHGVFPLAITAAAVSTLWDSTTNQPVGGATPTHATFNQSSMSWTSFNTNANDVPTITNLIANGNPIPYSTGDQIWIQPGVKAAVYKDIPPNTDILIAIVSNTSTMGTQSILGFASFHVVSSNQGSKTITGYISPAYNVNVGSIQGLSYGAYSAPRLVN